MGVGGGRCVTSQSSKQKCAKTASVPKKPHTQKRPTLLVWSPLLSQPLLCRPSSPLPQQTTRACVSGPATCPNTWQQQRHTTQQVPMSVVMSVPVTWPTAIGTSSACMTQLTSHMRCICKQVTTTLHEMNILPFIILSSVLPFSRLPPSSPCPSPGDGIVPPHRYVWPQCLSNE